MAALWRMEFLCTKILDHPSALASSTGLDVKSQVFVSFRNVYLLGLRVAAEVSIDTTSLYLLLRIVSSVMQCFVFFVDRDGIY